jgi:crotonobetainyl-CoA:carnitine CoA-transferase CaiB-like acyl-CoA transferase
MQNLLFRLQRTPGAIRHGGRRLGQDTEQVLNNLLGLTVDQIKALRDKDVL